MDNIPDHLLKIVLNNGNVVGVYCDTKVLVQLVSNPRFVRMNDKVNDVFIAIEDVSAFEVLSNRKELPKDSSLPVQDNVNSQGTPPSSTEGETQA